MIWFYLIVLIVYGIAFGILSSIAVKNKNRDEVGWFFIGFLFGVFGLIAAALVDKIEPPKASEPAQFEFDASVLTKKCLDCAETIKLEAKVCRFCQHRFSDEEVTNQIDDAKREHKQSSLAKQKAIEFQTGKVFKLREITCPNCHQTESIPQNHFFAINLYTKFDAKVKSFFGFQQLHLRCLKCKSTFKIDPLLSEQYANPSRLGGN